LLNQLNFFNLKKLEIDLRYDYERAGRQLDDISATLLILNNIEFDYSLVNKLNDYVKGLAEHHYPWINQLYYEIKANLSDKALIQIQNVAKDKGISLNSFLNQEV